MRVAVYTLTRDRVEYTAHCLPLLRRLAGHPFDHYVLDNGSRDGTVEWLREHAAMFELIDFQTENLGIARAANLLLSVVTARFSYDLVVKFDNDCEVRSPGLIAEMVGFYRSLGRDWERYVVSPRVTGINTVVPRRATERIGRHTFGCTQIVGGICHVVPASVYRRYRYNEALPKAWGNDGHLCKWLRDQDIRIGYLEDLEVAHHETTEGQKHRFPQYFARKSQEEGERRRR